MNIGMTQVGVLTSRGMSAIASVALCGVGARGVLGRIFQKGKTEAPNGSEGMETSEVDRVTAVPRFCKGDVVYGSIVDGLRMVDEVLVGCEADDSFVIHCHGNPLLVEQIVRLCQSKGATLIDVEAFAFEQYTAGSKNTIETEAKLAMQKSATLLGVKILKGQIDAGLSKWAADIQANINLLDAADIQKQCDNILDRSQIAKRIIDGVRIVIAGPPNSGKSTLLNCLSGRQETIVSDVAGTTRDWVSVTCQMGPLRAEFIDTAGLDESLACKDNIEQAAQAITKDLLESCDLIVYLQDATSADSRFEIESDKPVIYVVNKCDLVPDLKPQASSPKPIGISAQNNTGIDELVEAILNVLRVGDIVPGEAVAFTTRQGEILTQLSRCQIVEEQKQEFRELLGKIV